MKTSILTRFLSRFAPFGTPRSGCHMRNGMRRLFLPVFFLVSSLSAALHAATLIDFSPDTTMAGVSNDGLYTTYGFQSFGDRFTLPSDVMLTGASQYGRSGFSTVGDSVRFLIFSNPFAAPITNLTTTLNAVDSVGTTTQPSLVRNHATITPTFLAAGSYWFSMPGNTGVFHVQAFGFFDDGISRFGETTLSTTYLGDSFFQLEGRIVPEPATGALLAFGLTALLAARRRRSAQA